jgi:hypothetical protein
MPVVMDASTFIVACLVVGLGPLCDRRRSVNSAGGMSRPRPKMSPWSWSP